MALTPLGSMNVPSLEMMCFRSFPSVTPKINFLRWFILDFARFTLPINKLLRKDANFEWSQQAKEAFNEIKEWIAKALVLAGANFDKDFLIYSYSSEEAYTAMLMQKDDEHNEKPIAFLS